MIIMKLPQCFSLVQVTRGPARRLPERETAAGALPMIQLDYAATSFMVS